MPPSFVPSFKVPNWPHGAKLAPNIKPLLPGHITDQIVITTKNDPSQRKEEERSEASRLRAREAILIQVYDSIPGGIQRERLNAKRRKRNPKNIQYSIYSAALIQQANQAPTGTQKNTCRD